MKTILGPRAKAPSFQVQIQSGEDPKMLRDMQSDMIGNLVVVPGIVTAASKSQIKASVVGLKCSNCGHRKTITMKVGFGGTRVPRECENSKASNEPSKCPLDPYKIDPDYSVFMDRQTLKIQEAPELVPTGEMPRTMLMVADRELTDKVTPGNRVIIVGILSSQTKESANGKGNREGISTSYI